MLILTKIVSVPGGLWIDGNTGIVSTFILSTKNWSASSTWTGTMIGEALFSMQGGRCSAILSFLSLSSPYLYQRFGHLTVRKVASILQT